MNKLKKTGIFALALILALTSSFAVYAAVSYDSSQDPVVSLSGMKAYVAEALGSITNTLNSLSSRVSALELAVKSGSSTGSGSGSGTGVSTEVLKQLTDRIDALEKSNSELKKNYNDVSSKFSVTERELRDLIADLQTSYNGVAKEIDSVKSSITSLQNQFASVKNDVSTLNQNFKQISDLSTRLETLKIKVDSLTEGGGDIGQIRKEFDTLVEQFDTVLDKASDLYTVVHVPCGATVRAKDADDTVLVILRSGSAAAVSPFMTPGTAQGLNDLSDGIDLYDGEQIPLFHNVLIPRGGSDGRGITVTSVEGAYLMIGGDYVIVEPQS
ncbi:MAG: hypothetical protein MJ102_04315 [Clostridia bacterium]|nr:hypothetical protein [Clostridia bacterium]